MQVISVFLLLGLAPTIYAHKHFHDKGEILISQQGTMWYIQFIIPAINAFGFEHLPNTKQHKQAITTFIEKIIKPAKAISLNDNCQLVKQDETITETFLKPKPQIDDSHQNTAHLDVVFGYFVHCEDELTALNINIFSQLNGLGEFSVQWITNQGQGAQTIEKHNPRLVIHSD